MILGYAKQISDIQKQELQAKLDILYVRLKEQQQRADQAESKLKDILTAKEP